MSYRELLTGFAIDIVTITVLGYAIYFRRHHRKDIVLGFLGVNVGLFVVSSFVTDGRLNLAAGLGLFGLLSVIRLRSSEIGQEEIGYYFVALVSGLVNGLAADNHWGRTVLLDGILLAAMYVADHPVLFAGRQHRHIVLNAIHIDEDALRADLEQRLGSQVTKVIINKIDFQHKTMNCDVRLRRPPHNRNSIATPPLSNSTPNEAI
jgi:hypothetical protein